MTGPVASVAYESWGQRVIFGSGNSRTDVAAEVASFGSPRVLVVAAKPEAAIAKEICADLSVVGVFDAIKPHIPADVAAGVRAAVREHSVDLMVSVGGGSTTGAAKAAALTTGVPILAVPTTYAGSEATPVWGLTDGGRKLTGTDPRVLPRVVVYDAALMLTLPTRLSVTSGLNALAHCVDSWWAPRNNPISSALAGEGARWLIDALPRIVADGGDVEARRNLLFGTYLGAVAFAGAGSGLHHKICHVLGGAYDMEHSAMHAVVLPHVVGFNMPVAEDAAQRLGAALPGRGEPLAGLLELYGQLNPPASLAELGLAETDIEEAAGLVLEQVPATNPRPVSLRQIRELLGRACRGEPAMLVAPEHAVPTATEEAS